MAAGEILLGGLFGFVVGTLVAGRKKKTSKKLLCSISEASRWVNSRGLEGLMLTSRADLQKAMPESRGGDLPDEKFPFDPTEIIVTQSDCTVFIWRGDVATGNWVEDPALTADLRSFLSGANSPVSRPPEGMPPPPGQRPPPA